MKQVLIYSIQSEHVLNFLKGRKTAEIRKRDLPQWAKDKLDRGEIVQGYGYCTKGKPYLEPRECNGKFVWNIHNDFIYHTDLNGKVVVKFEVSGVDRYFTDIHGSYHHMFHHIGTQACLSQSQITQYGNGADLYTHHFTNITPIEPMELGEFQSDIPKNKCDEAYLNFYLFSNRLRKAPQSFQSAWVKGE